MLEALLMDVTSQMTRLPDALLPVANEYWIVDWRNVHALPERRIARKCVCVQQSDEACRGSFKALPAPLTLQLCHSVPLERRADNCKNGASGQWSHLACQLDDVMAVLLAFSLVYHQRVEPSRIHIFTNDKKILQSVFITAATSPPAFDAQIASLTRTSSPIRIQIPELVHACQHLQKHASLLQGLLVGTDVPRLPHPVAEGLVPTSTGVHPEEVIKDKQDAVAAIERYKSNKTPENWERAFYAFLHLAKTRSDETVRQTLVWPVAKGVQTVRQAVDLVSERASLFKVLPEKFQSSVPVRLAAIAGIRSSSTMRPVNSTDLKVFLRQMPSDSKAHTILEKAVRILDTVRFEDAEAMIWDYKKYLRAHPEWPSYFGEA
jgi:hypothetical protein